MGRFKIWPDQIPLADKPEPLYLFGIVDFISLEVRFLLIVVLVGALGSYIHAATSSSTIWEIESSSRAGPSGMSNK